jgi:hypothetical protein
MTTEYRIWKAAPAPGICRLSSIIGYDEPWDLIRGRPLQSKLPKDVRYPMNASRPRDTKLTDTLANINLALVVSRRLAEFLQEKKVPGVEYIQVPIINHKGKVASSDYFLVNILAIQDCLDLALSEPTYNHINKVEIDRVEQLVFDEKKIDPALPLFRIKNYYRHIIIEATIAAELEKHAFSGFFMLPFSQLER